MLPSVCSWEWRPRANGAVGGTPPGAPLSVAPSSVQDKHSNWTACPPDFRRPQCLITPHRILGSAPFSVGPLGGKCSPAPFLPSFGSVPLKTFLPRARRTSIFKAIKSKWSIKVADSAASAISTLSARKCPLKILERSAPVGAPLRAKVRPRNW